MRRPRAAIVVVIVAAALTTAACGDGEPGIACERPETGTLLCVYAGDETAEGRLLTADDERMGTLGSYCREVERGLTECGDIGEIPKLGPPLIVERGSGMTSRSDADRLSVGIGTMETGTGSRVLNPVTELDLTGGGATIDVAPGRYVLSVFGRWDGQDAELFFPIVVS